MTGLSRRQALIAAAALPLAPVLGASPALARAEMLGASQPLFHRFTLGSFEVTALLAGTRTTDKPQETFGLNASPEDFAALAAENFLPADRTQNFFTPVVVNTGAELVLFDAGLSAEGTGAALAAAGNEGFDKNVRPLAEKTTFLDDGGSPAPGITALLAAGHTPGHMAYVLESDGQRLVLTADTANHYVFSLQQPGWEVRFDADKAMGADTRKKVFGMIAADRIPFIGYHMPFPAVGYAEPKGDGFRFVPQSYQHLLEG